MNGAADTRCRPHRPLLSELSPRSSSLESVVGPRALLTLALAVIVGVVAAPQAAAERTPPDERGKTSLRIGTATRPDSLNPLVASNRLGRILTSLLYDELLPYDADLQPLPGLVVDWKPSGDGRLWLLELRRGLRWSDGTAVTARDVVHTLRRIKADRRSRFSRWLDDVTLVKRFSGRRVGVRLRESSKTPPVLPIPLLPQHIWSTVKPGDVKTFANDPPVGSGSFAAIAPSEGDVLTLAARENHWRGETTADEVTLTFYESQDALVDALAAGNIDVADDIGPAQVERLEGNAHVEIRPTPATAFVSLGMNTGSTAGDGDIVLREARVRRAIALALDRDELRELALGSYGITGSTIVPPALPQHAAPPPAEELSFDLAQAAKLLERAGLSDGDGDGLRETRLGLPLKLRLYTRRSLPETKVVGDRVAEALRAIGIEAALSELTDRELARRIRSGRYDLFIWGWDVGSDPSFIASVLSCAEALPSGLSDTFFCDPGYDELYNRYTSSKNSAKRQTLLAAMQARAYSRAPYVVLYYRPTFQAFRSDRFDAPADISVPIVFALPPAQPINLEPRPGAPPQAAPEGAESETTAAEPGTDLADEVRSSLLWRILAVAAVVVVALLLVPRLIRGLLWLARRRRREDADVSTDAENDGGRP